MPTAQGLEVLTLNEYQKSCETDIDMGESGKPGVKV